MSKLFDPTEINGMTLKNRFVRSATWEGMATDDGACTPKLLDTIARLAEGGVGLIITGHAYVKKQGQAVEWQLGIYEDSLIPGLREMTDAVHQSDGRIIAQLAHSGLFADPALTGHPPLGPSAISGITKHTVHEMTLSDIRNVVESFGLAAQRAQKAGFDGIQLHVAHGYLLSQFLSPFFNRRSDRYGGNIENRAIIHLEIIDAVRSYVGSDYPVLIKMNTRDFIEGGLELEEALKAGKLLAQNPLDAIELSGGTGLSGKFNPIRTGIRKQADEAYFEDAAVLFKEHIDIPIILVGGIRSFEVAERIVNSGIADHISMSRPFIREPDLINRWKSGDLSKAGCLSDSRCFVPARTGKGIYCVMEERERKKGSKSNLPQRPQSSRR
ncbi:MAG: NADH:flavin oxidoreductase [Thermodesulfobacteriota bacterium]|nr:NADH:flavin oxidoreductase [Thermodesulfobacteriota bacterium]